MTTLTPDAAVSRRDFLARSGALIVAIGAAGAAHRLGVAPGTVAAQGINGNPASQLDAWIAITADGRVTAYTGKCELGQGLFTAQTQLVAEELSVPVDRVTLIMCDTDRTPDQGTTSGAQSHPANFNQANLALAGATARDALVRLASTQLGVPVAQLVARDGAVQVASDATRRVTYGELVGGRTFDLMLDRQARRKHPSAWTVLGTSVKRLDIPALVTGRYEYAQDVRVPGMRHGRVVRPPSPGATLASVDEASVRGAPGNVRVVVRKNFVGVVADKPFEATRAAQRLKVQWNPGPALPAQAGWYDIMRTRPARETFTTNAGDVDEQLKSAARVMRATYLYPYQMHGSLGTSCAVADVRSDRATVWSSSQAVYPLRNTVATVLGMKPEQVRIVFRLGPGCYGVNQADSVSYDAAMLSQADGRPVRVQLSRQDEMAWENYGLAFVIDQQVALDAADAIVAWDYVGWSPTKGGRPGANNPGNVASGNLAGFQVPGFQPRSPAPAPSGGFNNGNNVASSYVAGCVGTQCAGTGVVKSERFLSKVIESPFFTGPLRSPNRLQNTFAHESFLDEIAASVKADPVEYRLRHIRDPRLREVVSAAAKAANWDTRPSPKPGGRRIGVATGRGIACVLYEGDNGYCATVAEVAVDLRTGVVQVRRFVSALDCGPISNPDGVRNQIEGGLIQGISRTIREEVTWDATRVRSVDWRSYPPFFLHDQVPVIESVLINRADVPATGAGETSVTVAAAAIGNAIFDATGVRLRQVPFTAERVKEALANRDSTA